MAHAAFVLGGEAVLTGGQQRAPATERGELKLWSAAGGELLKRFEGDFAQVRGLEASPDGKTVVVLGYDEIGKEPATFVLLDPQTGKTVGNLPPQRARPQAMVFAPDGKTLAVGNDDGSVGLYDVPEGRLRKPLPRQPGTITSLSFADGGRLLALGACPKNAFADERPGAVTVWDLVADKEVASIPTPRAPGTPSSSR